MTKFLRNWNWWESFQLKFWKNFSIFLIPETIFSSFIAFLKKNFPCFIFGQLVSSILVTVVIKKHLFLLERMRDVLAHEMCHAATFLLDGVLDGHGPLWKAWACKVNFSFKKIPKITVTHSYEIQKKFIFKCLKCSHEWV